MRNRITSWHATVLTGSLLLIIAISIVAVVGFDSGGRLASDDVDLLAAPLDADASALDSNLVWALQWTNTGAATAEEIEARFSPDLLLQVPVEAMIAQQPQVLADAPYTLRGVLESESSRRALSLVGRGGTSYALVVSVTPSGLIDGLLITPDSIGSDPMTSAELMLQLTAGLTLGAAGLTVGRRNFRGGLLLSLAGLLAVAQVGQLSERSLLFTFGLMAGPGALAVAGHALLSGTYRLRGQRILAVSACYGTAILASAHIVVVDTARFLLPPTPGSAHSPEVASGLLDLRAAASLLVSATVASLLVAELLGKGRNISTVVFFGAGIVACGVVVGVSISWLGGENRLDLTMSALLDAALIAVAVGALGMTLLDSFDLHDVARLVADLGEESAPLALNESVGRALGDSSVEVLHWSVDLAGYVTAAGERRDPDMDGPGRIVTKLVAREQPLAAVIHDASLGIPASRVAAVCAAARIALDNERLRAEVRAQLTEVTASRARLMGAADDARRQFERDLHDGAQQRLLAVLIQLRRTAARHATTDAATIDDELNRAADDLATAIDDLRAIGRGLHPPALDHGLAAALRTVAEASTLPVELELAPTLNSFGATIDAAAYYVVAEAIANTVRHAAATHVRVVVSASASELNVEVIDDGRGGADPRRGTGLLRLMDRAAALGGTLTFVSQPTEGTRIILRLPVASGSQLSSLSGAS